MVYYRKKKMVTVAYIKMDKISTVDLSFYVRNCYRSVIVAVFEGERTKNGSTLKYTKIIRLRTLSMTA